MSENPDVGVDAADVFATIDGMGKSPFSTRQYELISAIQKFVRRGMEQEALRAFFELAEGGPAPFNYVLFRLRVIAHEDIGVADMQAVLFAEQAIATCRDFKRTNNPSWTLAGANAVMALVRAPKTRASDDGAWWARGTNGEAPLDLEPFASFVFDKHTARGKRAGRGMEHFLDEAAVLANEAAEYLNPYKAHARRFYLDGIPSADIDDGQPEGGGGPKQGRFQS